MRNVVLLSTLLIFAGTMAAAQNSPPSCDGDITIVRVSKIEPGGMDGFMKGVETARTS